MRIYSMTATFGKLQHETLTLEPGLNVIYAPNEWGKSTWCAFLLNMLYGIDTRARVSGGSVPDKERYAPWSGAPMSGRIELCWNGRDITVERTSNARTPMGVFRAYETKTGLDVEELTASNCGQMLLGVERSVFSRAGFIRLTDLPVEQDDALRRRLNNLVTTGDESGTADKLGQTLRDLKNKCRSNKANGLIPEAEARRDSLRQKLTELQGLQTRYDDLQNRNQELDIQIAQLENHKSALDYARYLEDQEKLKTAKQALEESNIRLQSLEEKVAMLPAEGEEQALETAKHLQQEQMRLQAQRQALPPEPQQEAPVCFQNMGGADAQQAAKEDTLAWEQMLAKKKRASSQTAIGAGVAGVMLIAGILLTAPISFAALAVAAVGIVLMILGVSGSGKAKKQAQTLQDKYTGIQPEQWLSQAQSYAAYKLTVEHYEKQVQDLQQQEKSLEQEILSFAGDMTLEEKQNLVEGAKRLREDMEAARKETQRAEEFVSTLEAMTQPVQPPTQPDSLQYPRRHTEELLQSARFEQQQVRLKIAECEGQRQMQGHENKLREEVEWEKRRIAKLESYYEAIELAQNALSKAAATLQRRFAPRISKRTQELFRNMTQNRYQRLAMAEDMRLAVAAEDEDTLRDAQRRSDGTVDQLYLALRLAVAEELTPNAPLVLDDVLVRFDDERLAAAMDILAEESRQKQVILFTCQKRECVYQKDLTESSK